jgi:hypothetical protein
MRQLPLEAYSSASATNTSTEAVQLPPDLEAPPTPGAPSLAADDAQEAASSNKLNLLSVVKGYATKVSFKMNSVISHVKSTLGMNLCSRAFF